MNLSKEITIAVAESCTGGQLSAWFTHAAGASDTFLGGVVAYSNQLKVSLLGVSKATLSAYGAVSVDVAQEMAEAILQLSGADIGISTTGIAGPSGGTKEKPVGLVYIGIATRMGTSVTECRFSGDRSSVQQQAVQKAITLLEATQV